MKKIYLYLAALSLLFGSCENNFDPQIYGSLLPGQFPTNEKEYEAYMMTCYLPFTTVWTYDMSSAGLQHGWYIQSGGVVRMFDSTTDIEGENNSSNDFGRLTRGDFSNAVYYWRGTVSDENSPNHFPKTAQITRYTEIIDVLEKADIDKAKREELVGEARLCRGIMMYFLMHNFGPVRVVLDPEKINDPETLSNISRPTLDEMCGWIKDDLEYGVEHVQETTPDRGRFTKDVARVFLMRHCLNEGEHMQGYYDRGLEMYRELVSTGKYRLFKEGDNPYAEQFLNKNKFNCEVIAAISCSEQADGGPMHGNMNAFMMWALPSDVAVSETFIRGGGWLQAFSIDKNFYSTFDSNDLRRKTIVTSYVANDGVTVTRNHFGSRWFGYIINKWPQETNTTFQGQDIPVARWAEVLLNFAELDVRKKGTVTAEALAAVNEVRDRAGLPGLSGRAATVKDDFLEALLTERAHELFFEGNRKIDLIRFNKYAQKFYENKSRIPTHQYMPLPNYAVEQAAASGITLEQTYSREGWEEDVAKANPSGI